MTKIKWKELTPEHDGRKAYVSIKEPGIPNESYFGHLDVKLNCVPMLIVKGEPHTFAWYWDVEFFDDELKMQTEITLETP